MILVFRAKHRYKIRQINRELDGGLKWKWGGKNPQVSANISLYLGSGTR